MKEYTLTICPNCNSVEFTNGVCSCGEVLPVKEVK